MRQPLCPYFGTCAGCDTQHLEYEIQLKNKVKSLSSFTNFPADKLEVFHDKEYHYRNRMDFVFQSDRLGLRAKSNKIMDIENCPISNDRLNELLSETRIFFNKIMRRRRMLRKKHRLERPRTGKCVLHICYLYLNHPMHPFDTLDFFHFLCILSKSCRIP